MIEQLKARRSACAERLVQQSYGRKMTPERWENVEDIFNAALDRSIDEREAFLTEACGDDPSLRRQVEYLINCYEQAGDFIEAPAGSHDSPMRDEAATLQFDAMVGRRVGAYRIVREI